MSICTTAVMIIAPFSLLFFLRGSSCLDFMSVEWIQTPLPTRSGLVAPCKKLSRRGIKPAASSDLQGPFSTAIIHADLRHFVTSSFFVSLLCFSFLLSFLVFSPHFPPAP